VIAASGEASSGQYAGIAPAANILDVKVAKADGSTSLLRVLAGLQAVADRARHDDSLRVVNLSLSAGEPGAAGLDPLSRAIEALASRGLVVVVSAGNDGPSDGTVTVPGTEPAAITVGALDDLGSDTRADDVVAGFSSRGTAGDTESKPDLVASGVKVIGLRAPGSVIDTEHPGGRVGTANFRGSGTSMSTALTSGAVANLLAALPDLDPDDVKLALAQSAYAVPGGLTAAGSGGLEPAAAAAAGRRILAEQAASSSEAVATAYEQFPAAWRSGSQAEATAAWLQLPLSLRRELARDWAGSGDLGAGWLSRSWASRSWAADDWVSRSWASRSWASRSWASRSWASRSWASRSWAADDWASRSWVSRSWASRSWAADDWASRSWASRSWAASAWGPDAQ
jgi:serine protease AprX